MYIEHLYWVDQRELLASRAVQNHKSEDSLCRCTTPPSHHVSYRPVVLFNSLPGEIKKIKKVEDMKRETMLGREEMQNIST